MKKKYSSSWKASKQPRKQRKYRYNAPKHVASKFLVSPVSHVLQEELEVKRLRVREGDEVRIERGDFKGKRGEVTSVNVEKRKIYVSGANNTTSDGSTAQYPIDPSNVTITEIPENDETRL